MEIATEIKNGIVMSKEFEKKDWVSVEEESKTPPTAATECDVPVTDGYRKWALYTISAIGLISFGGLLLQGSMDNRFESQVNIAAIGAMLRDVPMQVGPWVATDEQEMDKPTWTQLECKGHLLRKYTHESTGETIHVSVLLLPKGPIATCTPETCYGVSKSKPTGLRTSHAIDFDGVRNTFWRFDAASNGRGAAEMTVAYAWSDGGPWVAAETDHLWRADYLYKIQTVSQARDAHHNSTENFLKAFLPELRKSIEPHHPVPGTERSVRSQRVPK